MEPNTTRGAKTLNPLRILQPLIPCPPRLKAAHGTTLILERCATPSQARLRAQLEELLAQDRRKDESMAVLLHEVRSPLASIQNAIVILRARSRDEPLQQRMHDLIERQVHQIARLTSGLCQMSAPSWDDLQPQMGRIDLCTVLWRAVETITPEFDERRQQLSVQMPEAAVWVMGDAGRLEQVFINLLVNAAKYSAVGAGIVMSMQLCDGHGVVQVRDAGIGIAADSMPFIFDPFARADSATVRLRPGMGMGLALVRSIMDSHHGSVSAASAGVGQGSEFTVRLKLEA
jgi:signal transduction histidine kinase